MRICKTENIAKNYRYRRIQFKCHSREQDYRKCKRNVLRRGGGGRKLIFCIRPTKKYIPIFSSHQRTWNHCVPYKACRFFSFRFLKLISSIMVQTSKCPQNVLYLYSWEHYLFLFGEKKLNSHLKKKRRRNKSFLKTKLFPRLYSRCK